MLIELKNCPICEGEEWESLEYLRNKEIWYQMDIREKGEPTGMKVCKSCGFVTYDYIDENRLKEIYDNQRPIVKANNIIMMERKNIYHDFFLKDIKFGEKAVLDIGCATGNLLRWIKEKGDKFNYCVGIEYSKSFGKFAQEEYNIEIVNDFKTIDHNFYFISMYHVLEHCQNPDKMLSDIYDKLSNDGYFYCSVPVWFDLVDETSGAETIDFENYFHLNHINVFTKQSFQNLLKTKGFEIIKEDNRMYGYTVLCQKTEKNNEIIKEDWQEKKKQLEKIKKAMDFLSQQKWEEALVEWPNYPDAYIYYSMNKDNLKDFDTQMGLLNKGIELAPDNTKLIKQKAKLLFQWDQNTPNMRNFYSPNIKQAEKLCDLLINSGRGNEEVYYFKALIEGNYKKDYKKAVEYLKKQISINPMMFIDAWDLICYYYNQME
jgi:SAM-dependent methyltransferase